MAYLLATPRPIALFRRGRLSQSSISLRRLLGRAGIGVGLYVAPLLVHNAAQLALHGFKRVVHHFCKRIVRAVIDLLFFRYQLVPGRDSNIDPDPKLVSLFVGVIRLFDSYIAATDMITELVQPGCLLQHHLFDSEGFFQAAISDLYWQLHRSFILMREGRLRQAFSCGHAIHFLDWLQ
jgi:hypothetical protein